MSNLTTKQEKFCAEMLEHGDASKAYRAAYNTSKMKPATINRTAHLSHLFEDGHRDVRACRRGVSQSDGMFGAGRRGGEFLRFTKRANIRAVHARTLDAPAAATPYMG